MSDSQVAESTVDRPKKASRLFFCLPSIFLIFFGLDSLSGFTPISRTSVKISKSLEGIIPPVASRCPLAKLSPIRFCQPGEWASASFAYSFKIFIKLGRSSSGRERKVFDIRAEKWTIPGVYPSFAHWSTQNKQIDGNVRKFYFRPTIIATNFFAFLSVPAHRVAMTGWTWQSLVMRMRATVPSLLNFGGAAWHRLTSRFTCSRAARKFGEAANVDGESAVIRASQASFTANYEWKAIFFLTTKYFTIKFGCSTSYE